MEYAGVQAALLMDRKQQQASNPFPSQQRYLEVMNSVRSPCKHGKGLKTRPPGKHTNVGYWWDNTRELLPRIFFHGIYVVSLDYLLFTKLEFVDL